MDDESDFIVGIIVIIIIFGVLVFGALEPYFEANAFNKCTGGHATYFTAVFTELRVQDCKN